MQDAPAAPSRIRRLIPPLLEDAPDFRRLWAGQTISVLGADPAQMGLRGLPDAAA